MRKVWFLLASLTVLTLVSNADAGWRRQSRRGGGDWTPSVQVADPPRTVEVSPATEDGEVQDALEEVNAVRARSGLRPFVLDEGLMRAARGCAHFRAARLIEGHVDDFAALPAGTTARAAGCAAWPAGTGWGACCTYDTQYIFAGAARCKGRDGRMYMHLFVRRHDRS